MTSGVPKIPTMTASVPNPATVPQMGERHPRVLPTASTIVNASTHSTMLATKAGKAAMASVAKATLMYGSLLVSERLKQCYFCTGSYATTTWRGSLLHTGYGGWAPITPKTTQLTLSLDRRHRASHRLTG